MKSSPKVKYYKLILNQSQPLHWPQTSLFSCILFNVYWGFHEMIIDHTLSVISNKDWYVSWRLSWFNWNTVRGHLTSLISLANRVNRFFAICNLPLYISPMDNDYRLLNSMPKKTANLHITPQALFVPWCASLTKSKKIRLLLFRQLSCKLIAKLQNQKWLIKNEVDG